MKKLILVMLLLGATYATTQAQHRGRGRGHDRDRYEDRYDRDRHDRDRYDDDCDDDRRGRRGHYKKVRYYDRHYRYHEPRVVVVRPGIPCPPPPPILVPHRPRVSGVIVFGNR